MVINPEQKGCEYTHNVWIAVMGWMIHGILLGISGESSKSGEYVDRSADGWVSKCSGAVVLALLTTGQLSSPCRGTLKHSPFQTANPTPTITANPKYQDSIAGSPARARARYHSSIVSHSKQFCQWAGGYNPKLEHNLTPIISCVSWSEPLEETIGLRAAQRSRVSCRFSLQKIGCGLFNSLLWKDMCHPKHPKSIQNRYGKAKIFIHHMQIILRKSLFFVPSIFVNLLVISYWKWWFSI